MKKPEEIKKGLECCSVDDMHCGPGCPYKDDCLEESRYKGLESDALAYIQQLEAENERLLNSYDAALCEAADMHSISKEVEAQVPRWIPVEERLPEDMVDVLLYGEGRYGMGVLSCGWWCCEDFDGKHITHWMPLPEAPKEDAHD